LAPGIGRASPRVSQAADKTNETKISSRIVPKIVPTRAMGSAPACVSWESEARGPSSAQNAPRNAHIGGATATPEANFPVLTNLAHFSPANRGRNSPEFEKSASFSVDGPVENSFIAVGDTRSRRCPPTDLCLGGRVRRAETPARAGCRALRPVASVDSSTSWESDNAYEQSFRALIYAALASALCRATGLDRGGTVALHCPFVGSGSM